MLGEVIRHAREEKNLTRTEVAHRAGIAERTLRRYENNAQSPTFDVLKCLAKVLDKSLVELLAEEEQEIVGRQN